VKIRVEEVFPDTAEWAALGPVVDEAQPGSGAVRGGPPWEWWLAWHVLAAYLPDQPGPVGFLRYVVQPIGPDAECESVVLADAKLTEAKILDFGVLPAWRRNGVGTALQLAAIEGARAAGCWQVRSHSSGSARANHQLKLRLGFAAHPIVREEPDGTDRAGCYFVLPLQGPTSSGTAGYARVEQAPITA
jgi:GNAT superfamily N-acetyltransferase